MDVQRSSLDDDRPTPGPPRERTKVQCIRTAHSELIGPRGIADGGTSEKLPTARLLVHRGGSLSIDVCPGSEHEGTAQC